MPYTNPKTGAVMSDKEALRYVQQEANNEGCPFCGSHNVSVKYIAPRGSGKANTECWDCHNYFSFAILGPTDN